MPRKRKKKSVAVLRLSDGALPLRFAGRFAGRLLVFSDASRKQHGGLAAVLFDDPDGAPLVSTQTVAPIGSNELELQAALFALRQARQHFPERPLALFSDNRDAVDRLQRAQTLGLAQDPELGEMLAARDIPAELAAASFCWIRSHAYCRGNALADQHAALAAA